MNDEVDSDSVMYDDTEIDDEPLYENEVDTSEDLVIQDSESEYTQPSEVDELPEIEEPQLRRSPRGHQPGRWQSNRNILLVMMLFFCNGLSELISTPSHTSFPHICFISF